MSIEEIFEFIQFSIGENAGKAPNEMLLSTGLIVKKMDVVKEFAALKLVKIDGYRDCKRWWTEFLKKAQYYLKIEIDKNQTAGIVHESVIVNIESISSESIENLENQRNASISEGTNDTVSTGSDNNEVKKENNRKLKKDIQD